MASSNKQHLPHAAVGLRLLSLGARAAVLADAAAHADNADLARIAPDLLELAIPPARGGGVVSRAAARLGVLRARDQRALAAATSASAALLSRWNDLPREVRGAIVSMPGSVLERAARAGGAPAAHLAVASWECVNPGVLGVALERLGATDRGAHALVGHASIALAAIATGADLSEFDVAAPSPEGGPIAPSHADPAVIRPALERAIARGASEFGRHRANGVITAALMLLDGHSRGRDGAPGPLEAWFRGEPDAGHAALRGILRAHPSTIAAARALAWCGRPGVAQPALDRLSRCVRLAEHGAILGLAHLAIRPSRAAALGRAKAAAGAQSGARGAPSGLLPRVEQMPSLDATLRRALPRLATIAGCDAARRDALAHASLTDPDPAARLATVAHLATSASLADFLFDPEEAVARHAFARWSRAGVATGAGPRVDPRLTRLLEALTRSPHASIRGAAAQERAAWPGESHAGLGGRLAVARRLKSPGRAAIDELEGAIGGEDAFEAIIAARRLGLVPKVEGALVGVLERALSGTRPGDPRVVASAAAALGDGVSAPSGDVLRLAMACDDDARCDARVRANAADALARRDRATPIVGDAGASHPFLGAVVELKDSGHHRLRGSAARAAIIAGGDHAPGGVDVLHALLVDERPMHRLTGVWLASRTLSGLGREGVGPRWTELFARVSEIARFDGDARVRARAADGAARIERAVRSTWAEQFQGAGA